MSGPADVETIIAATFLLLGAGFLAANARLALEYVRFLKRRRAALLTWRGPKPSYYVMQLAIGVLLGVILFYNVARMFRIYHAVRLDWRIFGQAMMFLYYAYLFPLSRGIARGFYEDGIWAESAFIPRTTRSAASRGAKASTRSSSSSPRGCAILHAVSSSRATSTPRRGGCSGTKSPGTTSTSAEPGSTSWTMMKGKTSSYR